MVVSKILTGTLVRGQSTITFTDSEIRYSLIRIYCDQEMIYPIERNLVGTNQLQLIYDPQPIDMHIAVELIKEGIVIVDDLLSDDSSKVLSAKQGKELKYLIDNIDVDSAVNYSTEEREIGTWIDGTTKVYERTFLILKSQLVSQGSNNYNFPWDIPIDRVVDYFGIIHFSDNYTTMPNGSGDNNYRAYISQTASTYIRFNLGTNIYSQLQDVKITVRYTKSEISEE